MFELIDLLIVNPIANILFVIYGFVGDFGLAIILFTVLVKLLMWPLTRRQAQQTKLMRKIQPELAQIKKNCNGNRQLESLQMMDLYKRNNIKPFRSILTLVIQLPIFIALYTAVRVMVLPTHADNLYERAYTPVQQIERINEVIGYQTTYFVELESYQAYETARADGSSNPDLDAMAPPECNFHPKLFNLVNLDTKPGFTSLSAFIMLLFALGSALTQYWLSRQQMPSKKSQKSKTFRQLMKEAASGVEPDQSELNQAMSGQMSFIMPVMMLFIMINLPGALVFYYFISNLFTGALQHYLLNKKTEEMEISADKRIIKELKSIKEAEIVSDDTTASSENKHKNGAKVTRISAKSRHRFKKKRR